ncbi:hypothetical protein DF186_23165, partial [Enterococcus hirae]
YEQHNHNQQRTNTMDNQASRQTTQSDPTPFLFPSNQTTKHQHHHQHINKNHSLFPHQPIT